jgi:hypothetical protein
MLSLCGDRSERHGCLKSCFTSFAAWWIVSLKSLCRNCFRGRAAFVDRLAYHRVNSRVTSEGTRHTRSARGLRPTANSILRSAFAFRNC